MDGQSGENGLAFLCHPYHRGGVTTWMAGAAREWTRRRRRCWFIAPEPGRLSLTAGGSSSVIDLLGSDAEAPTVISPQVGTSFEFGTSSIRRAVFREALGRLPAGVPVIVSDDPDVWHAAVQRADRNPVIGVLHADEDKYYRLARDYGQFTAMLVAVSSRIASKAAAVSPESKLAIIPCGIAVPTAPAAASRCGDGVLRLIWVGRIDEHQKRVSDLVRIGGELLRRGVDFELQIVGDGPDRSALHNLAARAGLADRFVWSGWSAPAHVRVILRQSDVLLMPSNFEGMAVVVMEALAEGCGVVASRVSGIEDYEHAPFAAECLRVHAVGDVDAATTAVTALAGVPRDVRQQRARSFARSEFDIVVSVDRYERVVDQVRHMGPRHAMPAAAEEGESWLSLARAWVRWVRTWVAQRA